MAADDAAVSNASEALDLAAAVIKLSRVKPFTSHAPLTTALVYSPAATLDARVKRLIAWQEPEQTASPQTLWRSALCAAVILLIMVANYTFLLIRVHAATEWLVR
jgi:hypothetical protein